MISDGGVLVTTEMALTLAESAGVCVRPLLRQVTDRATGAVTSVPIPCGSTRESRCPACAGKAKRLRMHQCREGWHLTEDPTTGHTDRDTEDEDETDNLAEVASDGERRVRSTRRRQDAPDLPRVDMDPRTTGRAFTDPKSGRVYQPSMFLTLTLPSYGRVLPGRGVPVDSRNYDYRRAALDALHFPKLVDR